ncbi:MAG: DNA-directed RNA polymerase subunit L [Methanobrevibacter arboriphilus]|jgi:DNA-directed RNA polymerase subunit L|uniref:DNA-directed RNA polymerase subunit L n=2 Tax=Methanobrevibacter arboriphilus TaxID=39441 RepID=A0ACA8R3V4_METAZ|nr:DNA-directed RNA polymerase subunit L [Methanobrevibacter arboriphilus]MBF4469445.1 DNA-directed RNA polymerase subunit L [Methanobrevibacter arboriphilus]MCC7561247.1 DNA-directed RNA polymerase subunit L [Methanobrevibacter arboriphilus]BBL62292.1 DNA-directed RNA polymerase subunit L [Methanobrevibacter arboriphilus]GLI11485.1 DNA-directed RNA polymerase subunit L [Methanobrevibacter arboriphilus]
MDDIEILKSTKLELELMIPGESHTICNALRKILMEDEEIDYAVYGIDHPLIGEPIITIKAKRTKDPKKSLLKASNKLKDQTEEFKNLIESM